MRHRASLAFWRAYASLPLNIRRQADKQFVILKDNPQHPSLRFKKIGERHGDVIWSARVSFSYRALALQRPDGYLWFWIGAHTAYDQRLS